MIHFTIFNTVWSLNISLVHHDCLHHLYMKRLQNFWHLHFNTLCCKNQSLYLLLTGAAQLVASSRIHSIVKELLTLHITLDILFYVVLHSFIAQPLEGTMVANLFTAKNFDHIWGLRNILQVVNPGALRKYCWVMNDISPSPGQLPASEGYSVSFLLYQVFQRSKVLDLSVVIGFRKHMCPEQGLNPLPPVCK